MTLCRAARWAIPTSVKTYEKGFFTGVDGVKVLDKESGEYRDLERKYVLAGFNYFLIDIGGGIIVLCDYHEIHLRDIAAKMGITYTYTQLIKHNAIAKLRIAMSE